jgi:hypothetical protein
MLVTPYFWVALSARSETKRQALFSRQVSISKPAASIAARYLSRCIAPPMQAAHSEASLGRSSSARGFPLGWIRSRNYLATTREEEKR